MNAKWGPPVDPIVVTVLSPIVRYTVFRSARVIVTQIAVHAKSRFIRFWAPKCHFFKSKIISCECVREALHIYENSRYTFCESFWRKSSASHVSSKFGAIAVNCALCAGTVHRSITLLAFRHCFAPHCVRIAAQLCDKLIAIDYMRKLHHVTRHVFGSVIGLSLHPMTNSFIFRILLGGQALRVASHLSRMSFPLLLSVGLWSSLGRAIEQSRYSSLFLGQWRETPRATSCSYTCCAMCVTLVSSANSTEYLLVSGSLDRHLRVWQIKKLKGMMSLAHSIGSNSARPTVIRRTTVAMIHSRRKQRQQWKGHHCRRRRTILSHRMKRNIPPNHSHYFIR